MLNKKGYSLFMIKVIAAVMSAVLYTLYISWTIYTPISERLSNTAYYSFGGIFAINFVPTFFIAFIMGPMLSPLMDRAIYKSFNLKGLGGMLIVVSAYLVLGISTALLISLFFTGMRLVSSYIYMSLFISMIFLFIQTVFQFSIYKLGNRGSI